MKGKNNQKQSFDFKAPFSPKGKLLGLNYINHVEAFVCFHRNFHEQVVQLL